MMSFTIEDAIILATEGHIGQKDKAGDPYIMHPLRVMFKIPPFMQDARMVAVMHDLLEDTKVTAEQMHIAGVPARVVQAVVAMTHVDGEPYADYIQRVKANSMAKIVKIADIEDNTSMERMLRLDQPTIERLLAKYEPALEELRR